MLLSHPYYNGLYIYFKPLLRNLPLVFCASQKDMRRQIFYCRSCGVMLGIAIWKSVSSETISDE